MDSLVERQHAEIQMLRERIRQLEEALAPSDVIVPAEWGLTASEARVFAHLTTRDVATKSAIMAALYSDRPNHDPDMRIVDVFVCKLRAKLRPFGVRIETVWGRGYSLPMRSAYRQKAA